MTTTTTTTDPVTYANLALLILVAVFGIVWTTAAPLFVLVSVVGIVISWSIRKDDPEEA